MTNIEFKFSLILKFLTGRWSVHLVGDHTRIMHKTWFRNSFNSLNKEDGWVGGTKYGLMKEAASILFDYGFKGREKSPFLII